MNNLSLNLKHKQKGISLIELMISLVLGLLIVGGVIQMFISTQHTYRTQEAMSRIQESGRYATEVLSRNIRQAGYKGGCARNVDVNILLNESSADNTIHTIGEGVQGWNNNAPVQYSSDMSGYVANTDVILIKHAATASGVTASDNNNANSASINLTGASGIPQGQIVVVAEDDACDIFQNASNANATNLNRGNPGGLFPGNKSPASSNPFSKAYSENMRIMLFQSDLYYIGISDADPNNSSLRRIRYSATGTATGNNEELVDNVVDMQIRYGIDTNNDRRVNSYVPANNVSNWENVVAVRISLLLRSEHNNILSEPISGLPFNATTFNAPADDRRMYQAFTTTVGIRNKLP